jgi:hypothetical protein
MTVREIVENCVINVASCNAILHEPVCQKRLEKWQDGNWILHHNNPPAHTSHLVQQFLAKHGTTQLQQPPYSPDLAPCDFFLLPRFKQVQKGQ